MKKTTKTKKMCFNDYQLACFSNIAEGKGHTVWMARAGTGKTTTLLEGLKHVPEGESCGFFAFNKSIAEELKERAPDGVEVSTLHSYGMRTVTRALGKVTVDSRRTMGLLEAHVGSERETFQYRCQLEKLVSLAKGALASTPEQLDYLIDAFEVNVSRREGPATEEDRKEAVRVASLVLTESKDVKGRIDFDDMIWLPNVLGLRTWKFDRVFIDETQDLNPAQIELALKAVKPTGRIVAVGDDRQAIYQFRGADHNAIGNIVKRLNAKVLPLSVTYRCGKAIVRLAQEIVPDYEYAETSEEGEIIHGDHKMMIAEAKPGDFILSRANAPLIPLVLGFIREGRKANIQGRDIGTTLAAFVRPHEKKRLSVNDFLDYLEVWRNEETERLIKKNRDTQAVDDKAETLSALCEGVQSLSQVIARIESLFSDVDDKDRIVLSTTHKAKGLERDRVFVLADTYRKRPKIEEDNLYYVAITRAKRKLFLIRKTVGAALPRPLLREVKDVDGEPLRESPVPVGPVAMVAVDDPIIPEVLEPPSAPRVVPIARARGMAALKSRR